MGFLSYLHARLYPQRPKGVRYPRTRVTDGCYPKSWFWELKRSSLEEQPMFSTMDSSLTMILSFFIGARPIYLYKFLVNGLYNKSF